MSADTEARLAALERAVYAAGGTISAQRELVIRRVSPSEGLESHDRLDDGSEFVADGHGPVVGRVRVEQVAADDVAVGQVGLDDGHGDSSAVGPDAGTSGMDPTVEEEGDVPAVEGDSSGGHVTDEQIGRMVQAARLVCGYSQASLAAALNDYGLKFYPQTVLKIEQGTRSLKFVEAMAIARLLDMDVEKLHGP